MTFLKSGGSLSSSLRFRFLGAFQGVWVGYGPSWKSSGFEVAKLVQGRL
jgi:hypothetical protein